MSGKPLRVLLVEDSEHDALLLLRELKRGGYEPDYERVSTSEEMEKALGEPWEVVLSDYHMPRFGALAALEVLRGLGYDTPFVVVSGKIGEDAVVEMMRAGAQDYVTKENMVRLCPAIERELREAEVRRERERAEEALHFLSEASAELSSSLDYRSTLASVARLAVPRLADWCAVDVLEEDGSVHRLAVEHQDPEKVAWAHELQRRYPPDPDAPRGLPEVLRSGRSELYPEIPDQMLVAAARDPEHLRIMREIGFTSGMIVPMIARERTLGAITLVSAESGRRYGEADLELAEEIASRAALAVDNARLYEEAQREISERQRAETRFRTLVEQIPAVTYIQSPTGSKPMQYMSPQIEALLGYSPKTEAIDDEFLMGMLHPDDRERFLAEDRRTDETGEPFRIEYRQFAKDGRMVWVRDEAVLVRDEEGRRLYWLGVQYDITEHKRAEEALKESEELYRTVVEQAAENIFLVDVDTRRILEANAALVRSLGYAPEELKQMSLYDIVAHDRQSVDLNVGRVIAEGGRFIGERRYRRKDGTLVDVEVSVSVVPYGGREVMCVVAHDVTERKQSEKRLAEAREVERNRIARDLHDDILQDIVYALQEIQVAQVLGSEDGRVAALEEAADALRRSVEGLRGAIFELRLNEELGRSFVSSLEVLLDLNRRMARGRYELELVADEDFPRTLPEETGRELVRIVQEALANVRRHAQPRRVRVRLELDGGLARVEVDDDGRGFDADRPGVGMGQQSMMHRARELGGELEVESAPGSGTSVRFEIPVSRLVAGREPPPGEQTRSSDGGSPTA